MGHRNARLTVHGRRLLVQRVEAGLDDCSSRPHTCPTRTPAEVEAKILEVRSVERRGQDWIGPELGVRARTVLRILRRHQVSYLRELDPLTGEIIRASKTTALRHERDKPGDQMGSTGAKKRAKIGFDYIHSVVDDQTRLAYSEIRPDEKGATVTGLFERALAWFAGHDVTVREVMTDNHWSYTRTVTFTELLKDGKIKHRRIRPHCPWHNGKVERFNRTLQTEWAHRQVFASNQDRHDALASWLDSYNTSRRHSALGGHPPISRLSPT